MNKLQTYHRHALQIAVTLLGLASVHAYGGESAAKDASGAHGAHAQHGGHGDHQQGSAIGVPGDAAKASRTIEIVMNDSMRFTPETVTVKRGETIRFLVKNAGQLKHEFNLGTAAELKQHEAVMLKSPDMEHTDPNVISLAPGKTGEVVWKFTSPGAVTFACLQPGHFRAGMKGTVNVKS